VSGQLLQGAEVNAGAAAEGQVGVPQRVEVGEQGTVRSLDGVGYAGGFQVITEHLCGLAVAGPGPAPEGLSGGLAGEVVAQQFGHVGGQGLHLGLLALVVPGGEGDGRGFAKVEGLGEQAGQP
jgi:hypothetical protein